MTVYFTGVFVLFTCAHVAIFIIRFVSTNIISTIIDTMGSKSRSRRPKKRAFLKNQHKKDVSSSKTEVSENQSVPVDSASYSKLRNVANEATVDDSSGQCFIIDMDCLSFMFSLLNCPDCGCRTLYIEENASKRKGCCVELQLVCRNCQYISQSCPTSKKQGQSYDVNRRLVYAMRQSGCGYNEASHFMRIMNMPPPPNPSAYNEHTKTLLTVVKRLATETMLTAAYRVRVKNGISEGGVSECGVSIDGSWQRRGYTSLNGVVTAVSIDSGEVLDVEVLSKECLGCRTWSTKDKSSASYISWKASHNCSINYEGSSKCMEPVGAGRIFQRSKITRGLEYTEFYGDGDSTSFAAVNQLMPYPGKSIIKKECIGHYQKRLGTALRKLKKCNRGIGGKGKLTEVKINTMQNYFGIALRNNTSSVKEMSKAIWSTFYHLSSTDDHPLHSKCPNGSDSWCSYQRAAAAGKAGQFRHKGGLPLDVMQVIKPIYVRLTAPEMLEKCLHGKTQNNNESFHSLIWKRCPKTKFAGANVVKLSTYDAVLHFNCGYKPELEVMKRMTITPGSFMVADVKRSDALRISENVRQSTPQQKQRRKCLRGLKKKKEDHKVKMEGPTYIPGGF